MPPTSRGDIVACGHLCLDIIPGFPPVEDRRDWFRPGRLAIVDAPVISTGGAAPNVGLSLHRLGLPVRMVARIGNDPLGRLIFERLREAGEGMVRHLAMVDGEISSYTVVLSPPGMDRVLLHCPGANDTFTDADVPHEVLKDSVIFHFGYPPLMKQLWSDGGERLERILARAQAAGALTSLDMSLPDPASPSGMANWTALLARVLPRVDLFVPSVEELLFMLDREEFGRLSAGGDGDRVVHEVSLAGLARLAAKAHALGAPVVLIKLGDRGAYLSTRDGALRGRPGWARRELYSPVFSVPRLAGTAGSGDATIAGLLASVARDLDAEQGLTNAVAVGACCVEAPDATSGIRTWEETLARVQQGWARRSFHVDDGWRPAESGVFRGPADRP